MSHELRSPLNAILGFSEVIADQIFGPEGVDRYEGYARNIHEAGAHLLALINDILDLSKVEAGELQLTLEPIDLKELIHGSVQLMTPMAEKRGVQLAIDLGRSPLSLVADRRRLRQMVMKRRQQCDQVHLVRRHGDDYRAQGPRQHCHRCR
jgi:signal transduction histidine kinase